MVPHKASALFKYMSVYIKYIFICTYMHIVLIVPPSLTVPGPCNLRHILWL